MLSSMSSEMIGLRRCPNLQLTAGLHLDADACACDRRRMMGRFGGGEAGKPQRQKVTHLRIII
jgi:hypothetical protein